MTYFTANTDKAYQLASVKISALEAKYGKCTNCQTIYEGKTTYKYEVMLCDDSNKVTTKIITVSIKGY